MLIELNANLPDRPGTLVKTLIPIKENSGNIVSIIHDHDVKCRDKIPVWVKFNLADQDCDIRLENIKKALESEGIEIVKMAETVIHEYLNLIMIGHVFDTDFDDTFMKIHATGAIIDGIDSIFTDPKDVSTVYFEIRYPAKNGGETVMNTIREICKKKNIQLITS